MAFGGRDFDPCRVNPHEKLFPVCKIGQVLIFIGVAMAFLSFVLGFWVALIGALLVLVGFLVITNC